MVVSLSQPQPDDYFSESAPANFGVALNDGDGLSFPDNANGAEAMQAIQITRDNFLARDLAAQPPFPRWPSRRSQP